MSVIAWTARSLRARGERDTINYAFKLSEANDITILAETRENLNRLEYLDSFLPKIWCCSAQVVINTVVALLYLSRNLFYIVSLAARAPLRGEGDELLAP